MYNFLRLFKCTVGVLYGVRIELKDDTIERLEKLRGKPIRTRTDRAINEILDSLELKRKAKT